MGVYVFILPILSIHVDKSENFIPFRSSKMRVRVKVFLNSAKYINYFRRGAFYALGV